jgi:hypothetical protein
VKLQTGPAPGSPADLPKPGGSTYTSRLLDAKKRARERGGDDD